MRDGWKQTTLGEVVEVTMGRQRSPKHATGTHLVPYLRAANVKDGRLELDDVLEMNFTPEEQEKFALREGDVLVTEGCGSIAQLGASAAWNGDLPGTVCFQNTLLRLRARPGVTLPGFVQVWARYAQHSGLWAAISSGTNIFHIGSRRAEAAPMRLPSLAEQERICDVVDSFDAAFIAAQRLHAVARTTTDVIRADQFRRLGADGRLADFVGVTNGRQRSPKHAQGDHMVPYVRAANVKDAELLLDEPHFMNFTPSEQGRYALRRGDVLVTEGCGSLRQIGASCEWDRTEPELVCFQNHLLRLRSKDEGITRQRLVLHWAIHSFRAGVFASIATGTNIFSLGHGKVSELPFPIADVRVQDDVITMMDSAFDYERHTQSVVTGLARGRAAMVDHLLRHAAPDVSADRALVGTS